MIKLVALLDVVTEERPGVTRPLEIALSMEGCGYAAPEIGPLVPGTRLAPVTWRAATYPQIRPLIKYMEETDAAFRVIGSDDRPLRLYYGAG